MLALLSGRPLGWHTTSATVSRREATTIVTVEAETARLPPSSLDAVAIDVKTAYLLATGDSSVQYLFVRRAAVCPKVCCEFAYNLYRWGRELSEEVAATAYGCDV